MCLILDDREDSSLRRALTCYDLQVEVTRLEFADACWEGRGPRGPALIGIERKRLPDLVKSMTDRRLSGHQLRGMWQHYDYCYLIIEGLWRPDTSGGIELLSGSRWQSLYSGGSGVNFRQVDSYISSLELRGGVIVCRTASPTETAALYASRFHWWQKPWDDHRSHDQIYAVTPGDQLRRGRAALLTREPGLIEKIAAQLPGIDRKAWDVGKHFDSVQDMVLADEREWMEIDGIGKITAKQIVRVLKND